MRWIAVGIFVLSSTLNFLDRNILAAVAPLVQKEFGIDDVGYGFLISAFSLSYALASPANGYLLDRFGLNRVIRWLVAFWSGISIATAFTWNYAGLLLCRIGLGAGESGGIPAVAKTGGMYLPGNERALGSALGQIGIAVAGMLAPVLAGWFAVPYGWRSLFLVTGVLGLLWLPLWHFTSRRIRPEYSVSESVAKVKLDLRLWALMAANVLWMSTYSLWGSWTTKYLVAAHGLTLRDAAPYAAIPPLASMLGGFFGGWLALKRPRLQVILLSAVGGLAVLLVPAAHDPRWATAAISASYFFCLAGSVNIYTLPLDWYGPERAGTAVSALVLAYGLLQFVISPLIGWTVKTTGYGPVFWAVAFPPLLAWVILKAAGTSGGGIEDKKARK
ncbi:MAG: major facilitator superfamily 1 [Bryobacterales bacterium]|nr:major facilitator superfamily 1 [Bryobacterales bacterium]